MDYKYYRDLKHNYLVLEKGFEEDDDNRYQYRMMEGGRIKGLLPCSERNINGGSFLYYEIGSMQPVRDRFAVGGMSYVQLRRLLSDAAAVLEELSEYLLGEEGLVFNAESVYTDLSTGEYRFLYCPFFDEPMDFGGFASQLLDLVDLSDERAAELAYLLCEKSASPGAFTLATIKELLSRNSEGDDRGDTAPTAKRTGEAVAFDDDLGENIEDFDDPEDDDTDYEISASGGLRAIPTGGLRIAGQKLGGRLQLLFSLLFAAVVAAMVYIRLNYILTKEENMLSILVMLVSVVTGAVSFVSGIKVFSGKRAFGKSKEDKKAKDTGYSEDGYDGFDDFDHRDDFTQTPVKITGPMSEKRYAAAVASFPKETADYSETVVLDGEKESDDVTLYSRNLDRTMRIALDKLPLTIGKMEGCVDKVLGDPSVSRIHCRLLKEAGKLAIMDLGSTNGTFLNGIRLNPREPSYIGEGDEIRMGAVLFDCR